MCRILLPPPRAPLCLAGAVSAQERPVPGDSARVAIPGCAKGRVFIVAATPEHEPTQVEIAPGRRFRLSGPKDVLNDIKKREGRMIEVTGLVRKAALKGPGGIPIAGGRVRIGGGLPPVAHRRSVALPAATSSPCWTSKGGGCSERTVR